MGNDIREQFLDRKFLTPEQYSHLMAERRVNYGKMPRKMKFNPDDIRSNSYFLQEIKPRGERVYSRFSDIEKKSPKFGQSNSLHALNAAGHGSLRLTALENQILGGVAAKTNQITFDKFYKKTVRERRLAVSGS